MLVVQEFDELNNHFGVGFRLEFVAFRDLDKQSSKWLAQIDTSHIFIMTSFQEILSLLVGSIIL